MAKNLQVNLTFRADTEAAKNQIQSLQQQLSKLTTMPMQPIALHTMRSDIAETTAKVVELKVALQNATNVNTGRLDFGKFQQQLKQSKMSLQDYAAVLKRLGPEGTAAFSSLASAIRQSEMPLISLKGKIAALGQTLKNTLKWQISSSLIHGLMSAFSSTVNYAKELNESLTNIRIVTGKSQEEMAKFAKEANNMAKALSASTTEYTKAALIYYRQGLDNAKVKERTDTTIKMSKVVGENAETVSEWMTAIWNNFDDGSQALERYADVITKLGATTASSAEEIATGLEKFAAIANTVGLSYDYATAALATVTAETRQSAEVVGTAFKTLFARIEGLNLGETLDDGTTLNKYSEALYKVGVNIKDSNGQLKTMDNILNEIGTHWEYLNKDQQMALAQNVAGIRQYNQFIALMDNWDVMERNLETARNSTGELEKQQKIYEQGIEGATARVRAQLEAIKNDILDEDDLIPLLNIGETILGVIDNLVKSLGGLPGLLLIISSVMMRAFGPQIASGLNSIVSNVMTLKGGLSGAGAAQRSSAITESANLASEMAVSNSSGLGDEEATAVSTSLKRNAELTNLEESNQGKINERYQEQLNLLRQILEAKEKIAIESGKAADKADEEGLALESELHSVHGLSSSDTDAIRAAGRYEGRIDNFSKTSYATTADEGRDAYNIEQSASKYVDEQVSQLGDNASEEQIAEIEQLKGKLEELKQAREKLKQADSQYSETVKTVTEQVKKGIITEEQAAKTIKKADGVRKSAKRTFTQTAKEINGVSKATASYGKGEADLGKKVKGLAEAEKTGTTARKQKSDATKDADAIEQQYKKTLQEGVSVGQNWATKLVNGTQKAAQFASGVMMMKGAISNLSESVKNGTATFDTYLTAATSILFALGQFAPLLTSISAAYELARLAKIRNSEEDSKSVLINLAKIVVSKKYRQELRAQQSELLKKQIAEDADNKKGLATIFTNIAKSASKGPAGWVIAAISAAAVAALIGIAIAVNAGNKKQNSAEEERAQETQEYANTVSEAYDKVKESYDKLKESLTNYNDAQNAIGKLQEGTMEWKNAIQEANQQVVELLDSYPELQKYVSNINGRLIIDENGQQEVLRQESQRLTAMSNIKLDANQVAKEARYQADREGELTTTLDTADGWEFVGKIAQGVGGSLAAAVLGPYGPVAGTISLIGGVVEAIKNNEDEYQASEEALSKLEEAYAEQGETIFADFDKTLADLGITDQELINTLKENKDTVEELVRTNKELIDQRDLIEQSKVDNLLYSQDNFITSNYGEGVQTAARKAYEDIKEEIKGEVGGADDYHKARTFLHWSETSTDKGEDAFKEYAELMGYNEADATDFKGDKVIFKYRNEDDEWVEDKEVTYEAIESALLEARAAKKAADLANKVNQMTSQVRILQNSDNDINKALGSFFENGNLGYLDPEVYEKISADSIKITEEQAKLFGYDSVEKATEAFQKAYENYDAAIAKTNILAQKQKEVNTIISDGATELNMSEQAIRAYAETLANSSEELKDNEVAAAKTAVAHYRMAQGVYNLKKVLNENINTLKDASASSLDYFEALGAVKEQMEKTFGIKVSAKFVEKNLSKIEAMANGSTEALEDLRASLVDDFIINLNIDDSYKNALQSEMHELMDIAKNSPLGMEIEFDNSKAIEGINEALAAGAMTVEEVENLFANANLSLPQYNIAKVPHTSTSNSHTTTTAHFPWWMGGDTTMTSDSETSNTTWSEVPYFGDNPPVYDEEGNKISGGSETSFKVTSTGNKNSNKDILNYDGPGTSGGESATDKKKRLKGLDDEIERYHEIEKAIDKTQRSLTKLSSAKDKAFGVSRLKLMDQEIAKQKELIKLNKDKLDEANKYYESDRNNLLNNYAVKLDSSGAITNYNDLIQQQVNKLKGLDKDSTAYKNTEAYLDQMKSDFAQYEESLDKIADTEQELIDLQNELYEFALEKIQYKVQIKVDMTADDKAYLDFMMQKLEDDSFKAAEAIDLLGKETQGVLNDIDAYNQGIEDTQAALARGDITQEQAITQLREYRDSLIDANEQLLELRDTVQDKLTAAYEAWNEKIEEVAENYDFFNSTIDNYKNIIDLVGKNNLGIDNDTINQINQVKLNNANNKLKSSKDQLDANEVYLEELRKKREEAAKRHDQDSVDEWDKQIKIAEEKSRELSLQVQENLSSALEAVVEKFKTTAEQIAENFSKAIAGTHGSIEQLRKDWDREQEKAERYLTTYKQTYEVNKLNRQVEQDLKKTDNVKSQKELRALQEEMLNMSKDGQKMSKYDLEYLQKKYDLIKAQQALQDAQNAKSVVRLSRDSEGNFGYVYTADQASIDQAQQTYEDKLYAFQEFSDKMDKELAEMTISVNEWVYEQLQNAAELYGIGTEEYNAEMARIMAKAKEDYDYIGSEYGKFIDHNLSVNEQFNADVADSYEETYNGQIYPNYTSFQEEFDGTLGQVEGSVESLKQAQQQYQTDVDESLDQAGLDADDFKDTVTGDLGKIDKASGETKKKIKGLTDDMKKKLVTDKDSAINSVAKFQENFSEKMKKIRDDTETTIEKVNELINKIAKANNAKVETDKGSDKSGTGNNSNNNNNNSNRVVTSPKDNTPKTLTIVKTSVDKDGYAVVQLSNGKWYMKRELNTSILKNGEPTVGNTGTIATALSDGASKIMHRTSNKATSTGSEFRLNYKSGNKNDGVLTDGRLIKTVDGITYVTPIDSKYHNYWYKLLSRDQKGVYQIKKDDVRYEYYDTGGYTGSWGPEGRLAMLHQKELVLNAHDTENFLTAIGIVRDISDQIEKNAMVMKYNATITSAPAAAASSHDILQQEVTIHAEFPNATNHSEIEEAFRNLTNYASQYANRKF